MRKPGGLQHWLGLALLLLLIALPASASATTTVRTFPAAPYFLQHLVPLPAPPVAVGPSMLVHFGFAPGYPAAGVQGTAIGLQGTTVTLAACVGACTDRYRPASSAAIAAGHYAERVQYTVTQPAQGGTAVGFDLEIGVHLRTGWVFAMGYFATGLAGGAGTSTITLRVYVDLGTAVPAVIAVEVAVNRCSSTTACP